MRQIFVVALSLCLVAACSSSNSNSTASNPLDHCFEGSYHVTYAKESTGDPNCPDLTARTATYVFSVNATKVSATGMPGDNPTAKTDPSSKFDEATCHAGFTLSQDNGIPGCTNVEPNDSWIYDLTFVSEKSFTGSYVFHGCTFTSTAVTVSCTYNVTGQN